MKLFRNLFFLIPFIFTGLNVQALVGNFVSVSLSQLIAYANVLLLMAGTFLMLSDHKREKFPGIVIMWFIFYALYYSIGFIANEIHNYEAPFLKSSIPFIYFIGFSFFLASKENRDLLEKVMIVTFTIANILLIYFNRINFSLDHGGVTDFSLDRAGGVYGDANNAAVVCLLSIVFIYHLIKPKNKLQSLFKFIALAIASFALFLTFSKTGFLALLIIGVLMFRRYFNPKRILLALIIVPLAIYFLAQSALSSSALTLVQKQRINDVVNLITFNTTEVSYSGRDALFINMLNYINENPILGNGVYFSTEIRGHNTLFGIWADAGIICFLFFLIIIASYFIKSLLSDKDKRFYALSIIVILFLFMITLQTIINQGYLLAILVYLAFFVSERSSTKMHTSSQFSTKLN